MEKILQEKLDTISEYWVSIERNLKNDTTILNVGFPKKWEIRENDLIGFEVLQDTDVGKFIKITPKNNKVAIDDLIKFVEVVIYVNTEIAKREDEFAKRLEEMKKKMETEVSSFYENFDKEKTLIFSDLLKTEKQAPKRGTKKLIDQPTIE